MAKAKFIELKPIPGGRFDQYMQQKEKLGKKKDKVPKNPDKLLNQFVDAYGVDAVADMTEVDIGEYVYEKGINHSLNMNVGRNIPWIEDGLKSVERRALYMMYKAGLYRGKFDKVAGITGDMIKHVHPHGDQSAADTIYRLGRKRSIMLPYVLAGGNFGNMDTMRPASPRYASASLSPYAMDCFFSEMGVKYPIFDVKDNYKYSDKEPVFLTSRYPNILMQWNLGIGKGAQAWLGAFNSKDIFKTVLKMLDDPDCKVDIYPDTPVPVDITNKKALKGCFDKSSFKVDMRAKYEIVADKRKDDHGRIVDKFTIVFTSLPLTVTGETVRNEIIKIKEEDQKRSSNKRLPEVLNIETIDTDKTPGGIRLIIEYEKGYDPNALAEKLFKSTSLGKTIGVKYVLITDNKPEKYSPRQVLKIWITQRYDQKRRYYHQMALKAAKDRSRLEAICTVLETSSNTDKAIDLIRKAKDDKAAIAALMKEFGFTEFQATCVVQIKLINLPKMSIEETKQERDQALESYKRYRKLLSDESAIKEAIRDELEEGLRKYGRDRIADVINLSGTEGNDPAGNKFVFYNAAQYCAVNDLADLKKLKDRLDKDCRLVTFQNQDQVLVVGKNGMLKILDGNAFKLTDTGISMEQLAFQNIANIIPVTKTLSGLLIVTGTGMGKIMYLEDVVKSTKSKITTLGAGDYIADIVPLYGEIDSGVVAICTNDKAYFTRIEDYPRLKRNAAGNKILKTDTPVTRLVYLPDESGYVFLYGEYGYLKAVPLSSLKFNRRKPPVVQMDGKTIMGAFFSNDASEITYYDYGGPMKLKIEIGKMINMTADSGEKFRFKLGTTIGSPVKVLKQGRNEFYTFN